MARQIEYGRQLGVPWGISESAFAAQYPDGDYQYQAFGVPGLGLKQGLEKDQVVAPYATVMAAMLAPREALENFRRLAQEGAEGALRPLRGDRLHPRSGAQGRAVGRRQVVHGAPPGDEPGGPGQRAARRRDAAAVPRRADGPGRRPAAAGADPQRSADRRDHGGQGRQAEDLATEDLEDTVAPMSRRLTTPATPVPRTHLLSNSAYHVMITNAGSGYSTCRGLDVTRWREDPTREAWGQFCYIRDVQRDLVWSAGYQPICRPPDEYEVIFAADKATIRRRDGEIETLLEVTVSPEQPVEVRRVTLTNHDSRPRELELTSYAEVVLAPHRDDLAHPAFGKLFLETEWVPAIRD